MRLEAVTYDSYVLALTIPDNAILSWNFPTGLINFVKDAKKVLTEIAEMGKVSFDELIEAFKSKELFQIFKAVHFSLKKLLAAVQALGGLVSKGLFAVLGEIEKTGAFQDIRKGVMKVDDLLDKYPIVKKLAGPALAGLLLWIWLNSAFTGDPELDLDLSYVIGAFAGHFTITDLFMSKEGLAMLALLVGGFTGIGVSWLAASNAINLLLALLYTGSKKAKEKNLFQSLKNLIHPQHVAASVSHMKKLQTKTLTKAQQMQVAGTLDAVRASKLLTMLGIKDVQLEDTSENGVLVFSVPTFFNSVAPLTKFYGAAKNESSASWNIRRLIWTVPEVNGQVMLMQVGKMAPLVVFKQM